MKKRTMTKELMAAAMAATVSAVAATESAVEPWLWFDAAHSDLNRARVCYRYRSADGRCWYQWPETEALRFDANGWLTAGLLDGYNAFVFYRNEVTADGATNRTAFAAFSITYADAKARADESGCVVVRPEEVTRAAMRGVAREMKQFMPQLPSGTAVFVE